MDKPVSETTDRRILAKEGLLPDLVQRLTDKGIIRPDEAEDMLALLSAFSDVPEKPEASGAKRSAAGLAKGSSAPIRGPQTRSNPRRSW